MRKDIFDLTNKTVILTGGLGLIGLHYIDALTEKGARVVVIDTVPEKAAKELLQEKIIGKNGQNVFYYQGDITNRAALLIIKKDVLAWFHHIDVLINNAALNPKVEKSSRLKSASVTFEDYSLPDWERELQVNLTGTMLCCQVFGGAMKAGGSIVNIGSTYGIVGPDQGIYPQGFIKPATYGVSKGAIIALTKYLATYWGKKGIRVNCVAPGGVNNGQDQAFVKKYNAKTPLGRMALPDEYNGIIVYLASDASSYASGALFVVDGGWTAW